ncbi:hypothetical protein F5Y11DRAFT_334394 [Daldinia sp. FL1419]|nr:hypothetical protein F5Y11DRAFT_334394 [Daldinia sp. FL1419]
MLESHCQLGRRLHMIEYFPFLIMDVQWNELKLQLELYRCRILACLPWILFHHLFYFVRKSTKFTLLTGLFPHLSCCTRLLVWRRGKRKDRKRKKKEITAKDDWYASTFRNAIHVYYFQIEKSQCWFRRYRL